MDLTGAHERSVQIAGDGYVETRQFWFSPNAEFLMAMITVVLADGSRTTLIGANEDGVISVDGNLRYPDDTFLTAGFSVDGRATISHARVNSHDTTHWHYAPDGSGEVTHTQGLATGGVSTTYWNVAPDGSPVGDVREHALIVLADGHMEVDTLRQSDGTVTTTTKVVNSHGELISSETTVVYSNPHHQPSPPGGRMPTRPPSSGGGRDARGGGLDATTRAPDPGVSSGGGWVGGGSPPVSHITDWWYRGVDGRTYYLGSSTSDRKTKEA